MRPLGTDNLNGIIRLLKLPPAFPEVRERLQENLAPVLDSKVRDSVLAFWDLSYLNNSPETSKRYFWSHYLLKALKKETSPFVGNLPVPSIEDVNEAHHFLADRLWRLFFVLSEKTNPLHGYAEELFEKLFDKKYIENESDIYLEKIMNALRKEQGLFFFAVSFIRLGQVSKVRDWVHVWLQNESLNDEEFSSFLYWFSEVLWFAETKKSEMLDIEDSLKYVYHILLAAPERAHFLEIDSRYFTEFKVINELAKEALLFKEIFFSESFERWSDVEGVFDEEFSKLFRILTRQGDRLKSLLDWKGFWEQNPDFLKDILCVVEGNLFFSDEQYDEARFYYQKSNEYEASAIAKSNLLFALAKSGDFEKQEDLSEEFLSYDDPALMATVGNAYMLSGHFDLSDSIYRRLMLEPGWQEKADFYRSTFCYEQGMNDLAVQYAHAAYESRPSFEALFHYSCCLKAVGKKEEALTLLKSVSNGPDWIEFYRFTLERDTGKASQALETLQKISTEYFQDPHELEEAVRFARREADLALLRRLTRKH